MYIPTEKEQALYDATEIAFALPKGSEAWQAAWAAALAAAEVVTQEIVDKNKETK